MNLVEAFKQIGRDIKALVTRADTIEGKLEELKKTGTSSSTGNTSTDLAGYQRFEEPEMV